MNNVEHAAQALRQARRDRETIGPTRHGITRGSTIYAWDPSGNRFETFCGGSAPYPDNAPLAWTWEGFVDGGLDYPQRKLHDTFLTVVT